MVDTIYYIGAGASCYTQPLLASMKDRMKILLELLDEKSKYSGTLNVPGTQILYEKYKDVVDKAITHQTPDTYAKKLHLTKQSGELNLLKDFLNLYFHFEQDLCKSAYKKSPWKENHGKSTKDDLILTEDEKENWKKIEKVLDKRYDVFFATLLSNKDSELTLPPEINIISWNYDNQFEIAFSNYCLDSSEEFRYQHAITNLKVLPYIGDYVQVNLNNWIIKLNGYSTRFMRNEKWDKGQPALIYFNFKILLEKLINNEPVFNNIKYSWEGFTDAAYLDLPNQNITKILNTAKSKVANARNFIIIGYSFPYFNREVDSKILSENNFDKVYIQVPDKKEFEAIKERLLSIIGLDYENRIFHRTEADQFFIPF